jgi:hypothetical protein
MRSDFMAGLPSVLDTAVTFAAPPAFLLMGAATSQLAVSTLLSRGWFLPCGEAGMPAAYPRHTEAAARPGFEIRDAETPQQRACYAI